MDLNRKGESLQLIPAATAPSSSGCNDNAAIVGGVVGGLGFVALVAAVFVYKRKKKPSSTPGAAGLSDSTAPPVEPTSKVAPDVAKPTLSMPKGAGQAAQPMENDVIPMAVAVVQPMAEGGTDPMQTLMQLKGLLDAGAITPAEFEAKKAEQLALISSEPAPGPALES